MKLRRQNEEQTVSQLVTKTVWLFNKSWTGVNIIYIYIYIYYISEMNPCQQGILQT